MLKHLCLFATFLIAIPNVFASTLNINSQIRFEGESSKRAWIRHVQLLKQSGSYNMAEEGDSPYALQTDFSSLDSSAVPTWESLEDLKEDFQLLRDTRFLALRSDKHFLRRLSWLYPDDGCFARAAMLRSLSENLDIAVAPFKLFIFGNLNVSTPNNPNGSVSWWYHVVGVVKVDENLYVIDPAIDPSGPLLARDWALRQVSSLEDAKFAICNSFSYAPSSRCLDATKESDVDALSDQRDYLEMEWARQLEMGRDPIMVLGDAPPWK